MNMKRTETSSFGVSGRINHDSTKFYKSRLFEDFKESSIPAEYNDNPISKDILDSLFSKSSESMNELPDNSIHLMITSPPYNVGKDYDNDLSLTDYLELIYSVFKETYRVLVWGGRACVNIANLGRKPYLPIHSYIIDIMVDIGFLMRGEIIWNKGSSSGESTAWGSWCSAGNPTLRDVHEYILILSKGSFARQKKHDQENTVSKEQFLEYTKRAFGHFQQSLQKELIILHPSQLNCPTD